MLSQDVEKWADWQHNQFMVPCVSYLTEQEAIEYTDDEEAEPGYYARLSAPGYMDCTDWQGPYADEEAALTGLYETFGDDMPESTT